MIKEYFSHDYHARNDEKLVELRMKYGMQAIGIYWCIIEMLYECNAKLMRTQCERIAYELHTDKERIAEVIDSNLFEHDGEYFWSESCLKRIEIRQEKSEKAKISAHNRWENKKLDKPCERNANALQTHSERNANGMLYKDKDKDKDKRVYKARAQFSPPNVDEFTEYFRVNGYELDIAKRAYAGYTEGNWHDSRGKPIINWKQKCQHVWFKPEHKAKNKIMTNEELNKAYQDAGW